MTQPAVIVLEFNELSPRLMDRFIAEGELPNFERLRNESTVAVTDPEESQEKLNPWVQWVTVHSGASRVEHGIEKLGEASRLDLPTLGEVIAKDGRSVWICGTMNLPSSVAPRGAYLPDPWNPDPTPIPADFSDFHEFVRFNVQEHTNESARNSTHLGARFAWFCARHGLSATTVRAAGKQLVDERRGRRGAWARASVLDRFQWDLFRWQLRRDRPALATFFSNSTAHYQHLYWRNLEPKAFDRAPTDAEQRRYQGAVLHGYRSMDALVGEAIDLADEFESTLMMCTALSQQPYVRADEAGGKYSYRPHDFEDLVAALGISDVRRIAPVMAEQFRLYFPSEAAATAALERLDGANVDGRALMATRQDGAELFTGCALTDSIAVGAVVTDADGSHHRFGDLFYRFDTAKSGYHHPDGMWWTRTGTHRELDDKVSLRSVAPTILELLGIESPETMQAPPIDVAGATLHS